MADTKLHYDIEGKKIGNPGQEVAQELRQLNQELTRADDFAAAFEAEMQEYQRTMGLAGNATQDTQQEIKQLAQQLENANDKTDQTAAEINQVVKRFEEFERQLKRATTAEKAANAEIDLTSEHLESLRYHGDEAGEAIAKYEARVAAAEQTQREARQEIERLTPEVAAMRDEYDRAKEAQRRLAEEAERLEQAEAQLRAETEQLTAAQNRSRQEFERARPSAQSNRAAIAELSLALQGLEGDLGETGAALSHAIIKYTKAADESRSLKGEWRALQESGKGTREEFRALTEQIGRVQSMEREAIEETRRLALQFSNVEGAADQFGDQIRFLNEQLDVSQSYIDKYTVSAKRQAEAIDRVRGESKRAADGIDNLNKKAPHMIAFGNIMSEVFEEAAFAVKQFAEDSIQEFYDFDRGMREIQTLAPEMSGALRDGMGEDIQALSIDLGRMSEEILPAVYQALSSGRGTETVLEDVALASEAARAGVADLDDTMTAGLAVMNAYGEETYNLAEIYDLFFFGIKEGVFTMDDIANGMGEVTSIAAETKTPLEDIVASLITMTRQGDSFNEAVELTGLLLTQLGTEGSAAANAFAEATGQSYRDFIAQGGSLAEALQLIQNHADKTGQSIGGMIAGNSPFFRDQQAARAALELTGIHLQEVAQFSDQARDAQGSMGEASAIMGEAAEAGTLRAKAAIDVLKSEIGDLILNYEWWSWTGIKTGISVSNAIEGAATVVSAVTNQMGHETEDIISGNLEHAQSVEDLVAEYQKLEAADDMYIGLGDVVTGTAKEINTGKDEIIRAMAAQSTSVGEFLDAIRAAGIEIDGVYSTALRNSLVDIYNQEQALAQNAAALDREAERRAANARGIDEARRKREQEASAIVANRILMNDSMQGYAAEAQQVAVHLTNQGVAAQEAMHGLDIYRESLTYAGDEAALAAADIDTATQATTEHALSLGQYYASAVALTENYSLATDELIVTADEAAAAISEANVSISESYDAAFVNAIIKSQGLTQATMDTMVAAGLLTQEEADLRFEIVTTTGEIERLTTAQGYNKLSVDQQAEAFLLLKSGMASTAEGAIALAQNGYAGVLTPALADAKLEALALQTPLNEMAGMTVAPEFSAPDMSGAISQAERLRQLLSDLASQGSAGGYGGYQNENGGVTGGGNIPHNAGGTDYFQGGMTWVGEQGPELVSLPRGTQIYNNQQSREIGRNITIGGDTFIMNNRGQDEAQAAAMIVMNRRRERANAAARIR